MKTTLEIRISVNGKPGIINFTVFFDKDYGSYNYDWKVNRIVCDNQQLVWEFLDRRFKASIESEIEEYLYKFNFDNAANSW